MRTSKAAKKITLEVPTELLRKAQQSTGEGVTETVRRGLKLVAAGSAFAGLRALRGRVRFSVRLDNLRADR